MLVQALVAGTALLAGSGQALAKTLGSESKCRVTSTTESAAESAKVAQVIALEVSAALCHDGPPAEETFTTAAEASATAFASALVDVAVECSSSGTGTFSVNGHSAAYAEAIAIAEAYAGALVTANTCGKCHVAGAAVAAAFEKIFLTAAAEVEFTLEGVTKDSDLKTTLRIVTDSIQEATVVAFAGVIATAYADHDQCSGTAGALAKAGQEGGPYNVAACGIDLAAASDAVVSDALAAAAGAAGAKACADLSGAAVTTFSVEATAVAKAMATAMTRISSGCYIQGKGYGCAAGRAEITETAKAVAAAFADGFAAATSGCLNGCSVKVGALSQALAEVLATATSETLALQCTGPDSFFVYEETEKVIATTYAEAIAVVIVTATVDAYGNCVAIVDTGATVIPGPTTTTTAPGAIIPKTPAPAPIYKGSPAPPKKVSHKKVPAHKRRPAKDGRKQAKKNGRRGAKKAGRRNTKKGGRKHSKKASHKRVHKPVKRTPSRRHAHGKRGRSAGQARRSAGKAHRH